jgi:TRAP transporter TAXI family solute receptor
VYLPLMNKNEITMGLNSSLDSAMAFNARAPYKTATKDVRTLARVWTLPYAYFVRESSGMKTIADLRGKKVVVGIKSNVSLAQLNRTILSTAGLTVKDVKALQAGGIVPGINMVIEGRADAGITALGIPVIRKAHAGIPGGIRILSLGPKATDEFMGKGMEGSRTLMVKPSKRYVGVKGPIKIAAFESYLNISAAVSTEDAYMLAKTLHQNWKALNKDYGATRSVPVDKLAPPINPIPYHDGAVKYYKEAGIWSAANDKQQAMLK